MSWDRVQRLELDLAGRDARIRQLEEELAHATQEASSIVTRRAATMRLDSVTAQRDAARSVAVRLEQELAETERQLDELIVVLEDEGDSQLALELKLSELRSRRD